MPLIRTLLVLVVAALGCGAMCNPKGVEGITKDPAEPCLYGGHLCHDDASECCPSDYSCTTDGNGAPACEPPPYVSPEGYWSRAHALKRTPLR